MVLPLIAAAITAGAGAYSAHRANQANKRASRTAIRTRVADAKAAGIHPLAALGANVQPVPSQPLLGDAALGGITQAASDTQTESRLSARVPLQTAEAQSRIRVNDAQAALLTAQSRTIASRAMLPAGATRGGHDSNPAPVVAGGMPITRDPRAFSRAQHAQDEFGDIWENLIGVPSGLYSAGRHMSGPAGYPMGFGDLLAAYLRAQGDIRRNRRRQSPWHPGPGVRR